MGWVGHGGGGFASGYVMTGSLEGAAMGAIFAGASFGVGTLAGNISNSVVREVARTTMHGVLGGIRSKMAGGSFSSGFKAAGLATVVSSAGGFAKAGITTKAGRIMAAAVIGGTISEMSGGKFANGAVSAAFMQAYNHESHAESAKEALETEIEMIKDMDENEFRTAFADDGFSESSDTIVRAAKLDLIHELQKPGIVALGEFAADKGKAILPTRNMNLLQSFMARAASIFIPSPVQKEYYVDHKWKNYSWEVSMGVNE